MDAKDRAGLLMDHYKDTFGIILMHWKVRNRLFIYALVLLGLIGLDHLSGASLADAVNSYIRKEFIATGEQWKGLEFAIVDLMAQFVLLCVVIHYYQRSIQIDRMYNYVHRLEGQLCELLGPDVIAKARHISAGPVCPKTTRTIIAPGF
jgi:hypothetical protein